MATPEVSRYLARALILLDMFPDVSRRAIREQAETAASISDIQEPVKSWAKRAIAKLEQLPGAGVEIV